jgi:hypothetical protein
MVFLTTSDNESFTVDKEVAERCLLINNMFEGACASSFARPALEGLRPQPMG